MEAFIKSVSYYLPEQIYTNNDLQRDFPEWSAEKVTSKVGINSRHIAAPNETAADMAIKAAQKMFAEEGVEKSKIDFVIFCTQSPDYVLPTSACVIQDKLGLSKNCGAFDMNLGCSGYIYGLSVAKGLIAADIAKNVLLLTGETYSKYIHPKDKGNRSIFGDAASATLVSTEGFLRVGEFSLGTDGSGAENLIVKTGGARNKNPLGDISWNESGNPVSSDYLFMEGTAIFNFTIDVVPKTVSEVLAKNALAMEDVNLFVFHQANKYILNFLRKKIKIPEEKFFYFMENTGNTVSSTLPICLCEARRQGRLDGKILLSGFGVGYSWGACVLEKL